MLRRHNGPGLVLDCLMHLLLIGQLFKSSQDSVQLGVWVLCVFSKIFGVVQAAWLVLNPLTVLPACWRTMQNSLYDW
jgi:hypothetical protein